MARSQLSRPGAAKQKFLKSKGLQKICRGIALKIRRAGGEVSASSASGISECAYRRVKVRTPSENCFLILKLGGLNHYVPM
jgi:hypothetical protein